MNETKTYSDGTTATGPAPLPEQSPRQQVHAEDHIAGLVEDYGQWMWDAGYMDNPRGEILVDDAKTRREEIQTATEAALNAAYAEGRKDEAESQQLASHLIDTWTNTQRKQIPWAKAVEITAIVTKLSEAEKQRLLSLDES